MKKNIIILSIVMLTTSFSCHQKKSDKKIESKSIIKQESFDENQKQEISKFSEIIIASEDGGVLIAFEDSIKKLSKDGKLQWTKKFDTDNFKLVTILKCDDETYLLGGNLELSNSDYCIIKINSKGKIVFQKSYGGDKNDFLSSIVQTSDGGYILGGDSDSDQTGEKTSQNKGLIDSWIIRIDSNGKIIWDQCFGSGNRDGCNTIKINRNGDIFLSVSSEFFSEKLSNWIPCQQIYKIDINGKEIWNKVIL